MAAGLDISMDEIYSRLRAMNPSAISKEKIKVLRRGASILKRRTDASPVFKKLRKREQALKRGAKKGQAVMSVDRKKVLVKVHILGDFMMKWFERGTRMRYTSGRRKRKIKRTGKIKANWAFKAAQAATEAKVFDSIRQNMDKAITGLFERINK